MKYAEKPIHDVVNDMLMDTRSDVSMVRHVHVFRREYSKCLLKGCHAKNKKFDASSSST